MELTLQNLTLKKEKTYFAFVLAVSVIVWLFIIISIVGLIYGLVFAVFIWFANGLFIANLKADCVQVNEDQLPKLYETYKDVCAQLEVASMPELYVLQSGGLLNAFATRHAGRDFVVLFSDAVEAYDLESDEIRFLLGHELGHVKSHHIVKQMFLFPGMLLPLLGPAYSRAREASCDRFGAFAANNINGAVRAMMILSGGKIIGRQMNTETFSGQYKNHRGFFVSWYELISGYPTLSQRVSNLSALRDGQEPSKAPRHPLSYFFALLSLGGQSSGGGNLFLTVFVVAMLAAIAIPNLVRAKMTANDAVAQAGLEVMAKAAESHASEHRGQYPKNLVVLDEDSEAYILNEYCGNVISGYTFTCELTSDNYKFTASPVISGETGSGVYTMTTDGLARPKMSSAGLND